MHSDEALHEQLLRGDLAAFDALYERHARALFGYIRRHLTVTHESEDVLHETFMALLRPREGAAAPTTVRAWLFTVARNLCLNRLRSQRRGSRALAVAGHRPPRAHRRLELFGDRARADARRQLQIPINDNYTSPS
jgi:RNA polymerase sigma factor (sigma-70 family)